MKKIYTFIAALLTVSALLAQAPAVFKYQAVLWDARGNIKANTEANIIIDILQGGANGTVVYSETHKVTTDSYGLINLNLGAGTAPIGNLFSINWSAGIYFVKVTVDGIEMGTSQLLSVPYALYATKSGDGFSGNYNELRGKPDLFNGAWTSLTGKPTFATVATSGSYNDLLNKPILFNGTWTSLTGKPTFVTVATSGSYTDLINKPTGNNTGDMQYWNGTTWVTIPVGQAGQYLQLTPSNVPSWTGAAYATLSTTAVSLITQTTAISGGNITNDGGASVTARGVCWSTTATPTITLATKTTDGTGAGTFTSSITGLAAGTLYYVRAYATNSVGTSYGTQVSFTTTTASATVSDIDGNTYNTVTIGTQIWMKENLKTTKYNDGTAIPNITDNTAWTYLTTGAYSDYDNTPANSTIYGRLYNWFAVDNNAATKVSSNGGKNVCPTSWHIPSDAEWTTLTTFLGGEDVAGGKLKETGITHWASPNSGATNETGFTALPSGNHYFYDGAFYGFGIYVYYWSSTTENSTAGAWDRYMDYGASNVSRGATDKQDGFPVRCLRDF